MDALWGTLIYLGFAAIPAVCAALLFVLMRAWGRKRDPMGGRPGNILPLDGVSKRSDTYHD